MVGVGKREQFREVSLDGLGILDPTCFSVEPCKLPSISQPESSVRSTDHGIPPHVVALEHSNRERNVSLLLPGGRERLLAEVERFRVPEVVDFRELSALFELSNCFR